MYGKLQFRLNIYERIALLNDSGMRYRDRSGFSGKTRFRPMNNSPFHRHLTPRHLLCKIYYSLLNFQQKQLSVRRKLYHTVSGIARVLHKKVCALPGHPRKTFHRRIHRNLLQSPIRYGIMTVLLYYETQVDKMDDFTSRVNLQKIIDEKKMTVVYTPEDPKQIMVSSTDVVRPGLALTGFFEHFDNRRIQVLGDAEVAYIRGMDEETSRERATDYFRRNPVALVYTHGNEVSPLALELAECFEVPILATEENTSDFISSLIAFLHVQLAPQITRHGVLVEVYGEGIFITGDSGVGKSETAIELIKRGHRFIADDAVELRKVSAKAIVGNAPELIKYYIELRGIGIVDVRRLFGMGADKDTEKVDMIINLEPWVQGKMYDRLGLDSDYSDIMGIRIPTTTIPVKPGRNLAVVIEIAAMNNRQKRMGYNTAEEFNKKLMQSMGIDDEL